MEKPFSNVAFCNKINILAKQSFRTKVFELNTIVINASKLNLQLTVIIGFKSTTATATAKVSMNSH
jgi:hypothetical protein